MKTLFRTVKWLLTFKMTGKQYLFYQAFGSIAVNGFLTAASLWFKRDEVIIPFAGRSGVAFDTLTTTFLLSSLTVVFGTLFIRRDFRVGRFSKLSWTPRNHPVLNVFPYSTPLRALMFGTLFTLIFAPITLGVFELAQITSLPFWHFFAFKMFYAVIVGMIVTPINALWVLTRPDPKR